MQKHTETEELKTLHRTSFGTALDARKSAECACFYCMSSFHGKDIRNVTIERDGRETAICPLCGVDSVLPASIDSVTLALMHKVYFTPIDHETP